MAKYKTHREEKEGLIKHMTSLIEKGVVPSSLQSAKMSLLKKLQAEEASFQASFIDNDEILKMPSMGVIKVMHEQLNGHRSLFGTDIKTRHQTRIQLYEAHQMKVDGTVVLGKLLDEYVMSEKQFADLLVNTNRGLGYPVTVERLDGAIVDEYDPEKDLGKGGMKKLGERLRKSSSQTSRFLDEVFSLLETAEDKGKIGKRDANEMAEKVSLIPSYLIGNSDFDLTLLNEEMTKRANEATLNIHFSVNHLVESKD